MPKQKPLATPPAVRPAKALVPARSRGNGERDAGPRVIVVGASAGGVEALSKLTAGLSPKLPAAMLVVLHTRPDGPFLLPHILARGSGFQVADARDEGSLRPGCLYVAPPDYHLLVEPGDRVRVVRGPKENRHRPAIDPLFRSAAWAYGPRVTGVLLSGTLSDGVAGLWAVHTCGGVTVLQDPDEALFPELVERTLASFQVDHVAPLARMGSLLEKIVRAPLPAGAPVPAGPDSARRRLELETRLTSMPTDAVETLDGLGRLSPFTCPECRGPLWELSSGPLPRFRCHVGHAYTVQSLFADQDQAIERALTTALQAVEENVRIGRQILGLGGEEAVSRQPDSPETTHFRARVKRLEEDSGTLRRLLRGGG